MRINYQNKIVRNFLITILCIFLSLISCSQQSKILAPIQTSDFKSQQSVLIQETQTLPENNHNITPSVTVSTTTETPTPAPTEEPKQQIHLLAVGDIMLARTVGEHILEKGSNLPFLNVANFLKSADLTVGNLECVISKLGIPENKTYTFRAPIEAAEALTYPGFDLVSLANNHTLDFGPDALLETMHILDMHHIYYAGAGINSEHANKPVIIEVNGIKLAFLAYLNIPVWKYDYHSWQATEDNPGIAWGNLYEIKSGVQHAKSLADHVIVMMHFGNEGEEVISQSQIETAHTAIDAGALIVIGSHPHVLQPVEPYKNGLIAYSLGNFVFDKFEGKSNKSAILSLVIIKSGIESYEMVPVEIQSNGFPLLISP